MNDPVPLRYIDYAPARRERGTQPLPAERKGKFVLIRGPEAKYFICGPKELCKYHAHLVERFCQGEGPPCTMNAERDHCVLQDERWEILGGGKYLVNAAEKSLAIGGASMAYGCVDLAALRGRLQALGEFAGFEVQVAGL